MPKRAYNHNFTKTSHTRVQMLQNQILDVIVLSEKSNLFLVAFYVTLFLLSIS